MLWLLFVRCSLFLPHSPRSQMTPRCPLTPALPLVVQWHRAIRFLFGFRAGENHCVSPCWGKGHTFALLVIYCRVMVFPCCTAAP